MLYSQAMKFLVLVTLMLSHSAWTQDRCSTSISKPEMIEIIEQVKNDFFPELKEIELKMKVLKSEAYFLQTFVKTTTIFRAPLKRSYGIQVNEKVFKCSPTLA